MSTSTRTLQNGLKSLRISNTICSTAPRISSAQMSTIQASVSEAQSKPRRPVHVQYSACPKAIPGATSTLADAFERDPAMAIGVNHLPGTARLGAMQNLFLLASNAAVQTGGELWSASSTAPSSDSDPEFHAAAIIFPPGKSVDDLGAASIPSLLFSGGLASVLWNIGLGRFKNFLDVYAAAMKPAKKIAYPNGEDFFYIQFIGVSSQHRGMGLAPALIKKLQEKAETQGKTVYLEASNEGAKRVYEKLGFKETTKVVRMGEGICNAEGEVASGQEAVGVPTWPMIWVPSTGGS